VPDSNRIMHAFRPTTIPIGNNRSRQIIETLQKYANFTMTSFTITVDDKAVQDKLKELSKRAINMSAVLDNIGVKIIERTQRRFETSKDPAGQPWKPYPPGGATLTMLASRLSGQKSKVKKDGSLNAAGQRAYAGKKLLIGESKHLSKSIHHAVTGNTLTVSSNMAYAAMHQFGGITGAKSWIPGKKIPARPFLPIHQDGTLYPAEQSEVLTALNAYLADSL